MVTVSCFQQEKSDQCKQDAITTFHHHHAYDLTEEHTALSNKSTGTPVP